MIAKAITADEAGGFATLSAACFVQAPELSPPLARLASGRHAHLAFAAEIVRMCRGESDGAHLVAIAPKIKESHRIALCVEMFVPLTRASKLRDPWLRRSLCCAMRSGTWPMARIGRGCNARL